MLVSYLRYFETTFWPFGAIATFGHRHLDQFCNQALHRTADRGMLSGDRRERTSGTSNDVSTIFLDVSNGAELIVEHVAHHLHPGSKVPGHTFVQPQFFDDAFSGFAEDGVNLRLGEHIGERANQPR